MVYIILMLFFVLFLLLLVYFKSNAKLNPDFNSRLTEEEKELLREDYITHSCNDHQKEDTQKL